MINYKNMLLSWYILKLPVYNRLKTYIIIARLHKAYNYHG